MQLKHEEPFIPDNEKSYLIIVDFDGKKEEIFKGIADAAAPYLNGMIIDMVGIDNWSKDAVKDVETFYKKKLFGLFI
ncbi:enhanced serine sensitivity protein SseB C-terminal domain-containing protein [Clostridium sp.]|uniref:enhanced serine sensitivity protein SseB C-terminal domain-containing protein n=1 Tax=Clostridium sp. TaxID=1506 RepID=UPI002619F7B1|nr:enhanced serine sensitivity protein SseB C-terminal domain-containing protein [Clostridium sp.]